MSKFEKTGGLKTMTEQQKHMLQQFESGVIPDGVQAFALASMLSVLKMEGDGDDE